MNTSEVESFVNRLAESSTDSALDLLYDTLDDWATEGRSGWIDETFSKIMEKDLSLTLLIGVLIITHPRHEERGGIIPVLLPHPVLNLKRRQAFYDYVHRRAEAEDPENAERLMQGLK